MNIGRSNQLVESKINSSWTIFFNCTLFVSLKISISSKTPHFKIDFRMFISWLGPAIRSFFKNNHITLKNSPITILELNKVHTLIVSQEEQDLFWVLMIIQKNGNKCYHTVSFCFVFWICEIWTIWTRP